MNDDLISRESVIKAVDRHTREDGTLDEDISVILEEVKTAFNKEKVIEEMKKMVNEFDCPICPLQNMKQSCFSIEDERCQCDNQIINKLLEIVEKGGID